LKLILAFRGWDRAMRSMIPAPEVDDLADYARRSASVAASWLTGALCLVAGAWCRASECVGMFGP
jgi:hypothetical protein